MYETAWFHNAEDIDLDFHHHENLMSHFIILLINTQVVSFNFIKNFTNYVSNKNFNPNDLNMMFRGVVVAGLWAHIGITKIMRACSNLSADILTQEVTYIAQVKYIQ
jgi:hypothetical protein